MISPSLDFIVIGAQKSGTTALHEYLRLHPELALPPAKEEPFFSHDPIYARGWDHWFERAFPQNPEGVLGKATPHYMAGARYGERVPGARLEEAPPAEVIPRRIYDLFPDIRLVALLRDPVDRAVSHHRMTSLLGWEERSLRQAVEELLEPAALEQARTEPTQLNGYLVWGEYARILKPYFQVFDPRQVQVWFTSELESRPAEVVEKIFEFIGVDSTFEPTNLGQRYYEGASERRVQWLDLNRVQEAAARNQLARRAWHLLPVRLRRRTALAYETAHYKTRVWNRVKQSAPEPIDETATPAMREHFEPDTADLRELIEREPPWAAAQPEAVASP